MTSGLSYGFPAPLHRHFGVRLAIAVHAGAWAVESLQGQLLDMSLPLLCCYLCAACRLVRLQEQGERE